MTQPEFRNTLIGSDRMEIANRSQGRIAPGSVYQCYHGDRMVPQLILEWQPFESMIVKEMPPWSHDTSTINEYRLEAIEGGTRLTKTFTEPTGPIIPRTLLRLMMPLFGRMGSRAIEAFGRRIEQDFRSKDQGSEVALEITAEQIRQAAEASLRAVSGSV